MVSIIGLLDAHPEPKRWNPHHKARKTVTSFCDRTFSEEYDGLTQRLTTQITVGKCGTDRRFRMNAIWDTGSMISCISEDMAYKMKLQPVESGVGITPAGQVEIMYYFLNVELSEGIKFRNVKVAGFPMKRHDADFLIGMDIISKGDFRVKNDNGRTVIIFECV